MMRGCWLESGRGAQLTAAIAAQQPNAVITHAPPTVPTAGVFGQTFTRLHARGVRPGVLYPAVSIPAAEDLQGAEASWRGGLPPELAQFIAGGATFLSINRFERKKASLGGGMEQGMVQSAAAAVPTQL